MEIGYAALLFAAGFGGGIAAAIAGGASLVTFPTLLAMGLPPVAANATNAVGLSLSNFMAAVADWRRRPSWGRSLSWLLAINVARRRGRRAADAGDARRPADPAGAGFDRRGDVLFAIGPWVQRHLPGEGEGGLRMARVAFPLFLSAIYGGYFGAALGVINLAILAIGGLTDLRSTNVLKNLLITGVSASSVWIYVWQGAVVWPAMVVLMAGSIGGGYAGGTHPHPAAAPGAHRHHRVRHSRDGALCRQILVLAHLAQRLRQLAFQPVEAGILRGVLVAQRRDLEARQRKRHLELPEAEGGGVTFGEPARRGRDHVGSGDGRKAGEELR